MPSQTESPAFPGVACGYRRDEHDVNFPRPAQSPAPATAHSPTPDGGYNLKVEFGGSPAYHSDPGQYTVFVVWKQATAEVMLYSV